MQNKYKNVLVTGGSGFIGKHLVNILLEKGYNVAVIDKHPKNLPKKVKVFKGDVRNGKAIKEAMKNANIVYHLAGVLGTEELNKQSLLATKINVIGALNVLEAARKNKTKVLLVSKPNVWLNTYSITKETSEKFCMMFRKEFGLEAAIVKWFSVYGPGQKHYHVQKAVPTFIVRALLGRPIPVFDDGKQMADFIYTSDTINATILVAESDKMEGKTVEIGTGKGTKIVDLAKDIIRLTKSKSQIEYLPMRGGEDPHTEVVANIKLLSSLGFKPKVNFDKGLMETINFYKALSDSDKKKVL